MTTVTEVGCLQRDDGLLFGLYLIPGYPSWQTSLDALSLAVASGVDFVEIPIMARAGFSPSTGPVIRDAIQRVDGADLDPNGVRFDQWFSEVPVPVGVVYGPSWPSPERWVPPVELARRCAGLLCEFEPTPVSRFAATASALGTSIIPTLRSSPVSLSPVERELLADGGFFVYMALADKTGGVARFGSDVPHKVRYVRQWRPELPIFAAFGISQPVHVKAAAYLGFDGFVVGSHALRLLEGDLESYRRWLREMSEARSVAR